MKKSIITLTVFIALTAFAMMNKTWKNDQPHSQLGFTVKHLGISEISGTFNDFEATISTDKPDFSDSKIALIAKVASIDTRVEQRDTHLKSGDFFDAEKFPVISFQSTSLKASGKNKYKLTGNLTMHGITKPVTLDLFYLGAAVNPINKKQSAGFKVTGHISRKEFNIGVQYSGSMISDAIAIKADGEFQVE